MASDHSFDFVCDIDPQEVINALDQCKREVGQRYDLKDAQADMDYEQKNNKISIKAKDDYKVRAIIDILKQKMIKRDISIKALDISEPERIGGDFCKVTIGIQQGIDQENAKKITALIKKSNEKVQVQIQGDQLRVVSKKIDALQACIKLVKSANLPIHVSVKNLR